MPTVQFYLNCCAIIGIANGSALSLQASPYGYNASYKSISTLSGAFPGHENSFINSEISPTARTAPNLTSDNDTLIIHASSSNACCFIVQDTIDVRYWADYVTLTTVVPAQLTSHITFATQYIDTIVITNFSTAIRTVNKTSIIVNDDGHATIPNNHNDAPGPWVTDFSLNGSLNTAFGATITSPSQFYVFSSVSIVHVSAISDIDGLYACATTSTYRATCSTNVQPQSALYITGINSNAESLFHPNEVQTSAMTLDNPDVVLVSFSKPFVYVPPSDPFPSRVVNENFGYVPQTLIEWMAQNSDHASKFPGIASCLPGGPSIDFLSHFCSIPPPSNQSEMEVEVQRREPDLTVSTTVTVAGKGCFHPGACITPATPGATAVPATAKVTPEAERVPKAGASSPPQSEETSWPVGPEDPLPPQAPNQPLPAPAQILGSTPVGSLLAPAPSLSVFTVAGQVFTANPAAFAIDGTTISAGGPGVTISGTPISLEASGVLDVGDSTVTLAEATSTDGPGLVAFTGKGERVAVISIYLVLASALTVAVLTGI